MRWIAGGLMALDDRTTPFLVEGNSWREHICLAAAVPQGYWWSVEQDFPFGEPVMHGQDWLTHARPPRPQGRSERDARHEFAVPDSIGEWR